MFYRRFALAISSLVLVAALAPAAADTPATPPAKADPAAAILKPCAEGPDPAARAVACTEAISGAGLTGKSLAAAYLFRGNAQVERQQFPAAIDDYSKALAADATATDALYNRAAAYAQLGRLDLAIEDYNQLLTIVPADPDTLFNRAWLYSIQGKYEEAIDDLTKVLMAKPDDFETRLRRAGTEIQIGHNEDAIADCTRLLKAAPKSPVALYNRGRAEYATGDFATASDDFGAAEKNLEGISNTTLRAYATLRLALADAHRDKETPELAALAKAVPQDQWPMPVVAYYLGNLSADDLLAATKAGDPVRAANIAAEAEYYIGAWALAKDQDKKTARQHFKAAIGGKADRANLEFIDAGLALQKLGS